MMHGIYGQLHDDFQTGGMGKVLKTAESSLRQQDRFHELFEVLKMQIRQQLGLPLLHDDSIELSDQQQRDLEERLLAACRDVGFSLMRAGQIQESWGYLKHITDRKTVLAEIHKLEVTEDNVEAIIGLLLYEGLDCDRGFELVLERYGTCNAITTFQNAMYGRSKQDRAAAGQRLVHHVHRELSDSVRSHIAREENETDPESLAPAVTSLADLISSRPYLFADGSYHIDTSHLSSTVQIAAELDDRETLQLALDMTAYGQQLHPDLQYPSPAPFEDTYPSHAHLFSALLGLDTDEHLQVFRRRAEETDAHHDGTHVIETYVDLLSRVGRPAVALEEVVRLIPVGVQMTGKAPTLYDLSKQLGNFDRYRELCIDRDDLLGFVIGLNE